NPIILRRDNGVRGKDIFMDRGMANRATCRSSKKSSCILYGRDILSTTKSVLKRFLPYFAETQDIRLNSPELVRSVSHGHEPQNAFSTPVPFFLLPLRALGAMPDPDCPRKDCTGKDCPGTTGLSGLGAPAGDSRR